MYKIKIKGNKGLYIFIEAGLCPKICSPITNQKYNFAKNNYDHLRNIKLLKHSEGDSTSIDLLIENDFYYSLINENIVKGQKDKDIAIETYLGGFILSGVFIDKNINKESSINLNSTNVLRITVEDNFINDHKEEKCFCQDKLKGQLNKFRETESVRLNDYIKDNKLMKRFNDELKFNKTRYCVKLTFKEHTILRNNFQNTKAPLVELLHKLANYLLANYDEIIKTYEKENIIDTVGIETVGIPGLVHYLPHHAMIKIERDMTKACIVFDASTKIGRLMRHYLIR